MKSISFLPELLLIFETGFLILLQRFMYFSNAFLLSTVELKAK